MISTCWNVCHDFLVWFSCRSQPSSMNSMDEYIEDDELAIKENELDVPKMD